LINQSEKPGFADSLQDPHILLGAIKHSHSFLKITPL